MKLLRSTLIGLAIFLCSTYTLASSHFLTLSDIHYGKDNRPGNGHDTGDMLWSSALGKFKELTTQIDFIILLGNLPTHSIFESSTKKGDYEAKIFHDLYKADSHYKPMFYVAGNNDSLAGNYQPFLFNGRSPLDYAPDWQGACVYCDGLILDKSAMYQGGYYSTYVMPNNKDIILIALNATQFTGIPFWLPAYLNQDLDANQQLEWLETQFNRHHAKQLLIAMHEPPGVDYQDKPIWKENYLKTFIYLLNKYQDHYQQISLLASHTHYDELRKITLDNSRPIYSYSTPSISRSHYNNPAMKVFHLADDFSIYDFTTYYTTDEAHWDNNYYDAIKSKNNNIFPNCSNLHLAACLDSLSNENVCQLMQEKFIYSVKNQDKRITNCLNSYKIN